MNAPEDPAAATGDSPETEAAPPAENRGAGAQAVLLLADAIYEHRNTYSLALARWQGFPDDPEAIARRFDESQISPTAVAEALAAATAALRPIVEMAEDEGPELLGQS